MKIRSLVLATVPVAACFCLTGCDSGGVEAVDAKTKVGAASTASSGTVPKILPQNKRKNRSEAPGPLPAPDI